MSFKEKSNNLKKGIDHDILFSKQILEEGRADTYILLHHLR